MSAEAELPLGRRVGKSEAAFRTISEVAEELDVPQHVLRFWESKFPQVKPLKRGGGRRYYRPEDVALLRRIRDLLYAEGYTIKGVQKLLREGGHKDAAATGKPQPELELPMGGGADADAPGDEAEAAAEDGVEAEAEIQPDMLDGEEGGEEGGEEVEGDFVPSAGHDEEPACGGPLSPAARRELAGILEELEQLRGLLQPRER